jgi:hypothetical protein
MIVLALVLALSGAAPAADSGTIFTGMYEMSDGAVKEIETLSGHWYSPGERLVPFRRDEDGSVTVRATWSGYRGRFAAHIVVDSASRVRDIRWVTNDGKITRSRRGRIAGMESEEFLRQFVGKNLEELLAARSSFRSPAVYGSPSPREFLTITYSMLVEALVVTKAVNPRGDPSRY